MDIRSCGVALCMLIGEWSLNHTIRKALNGYWKELRHVYAVRILNRRFRTFMREITFQNEEKPNGQRLLPLRIGLFNHRPVKRLNCSLEAYAYICIGNVVFARQPPGQFLLSCLEERAARTLTLSCHPKLPSCFSFWLLLNLDSIKWPSMVCHALYTL